MLLLFCIKAKLSIRFWGWDGTLCAFPSNRSEYAEGTVPDFIIIISSALHSSCFPGQAERLKSIDKYW
jgi:hypothetical protein